jgi:hypothetical protein
MRMIESVPYIAGCCLDNFFILRLSKTMVGSPSAYELRRHTGQGFSELVAGRSYIQLHAVHMASDPELHSVIDLQGPKLLSFWAEGA